MDEKEILLKARDAIKAGQFDKARGMLETIDHNPTAQKWLIKLGDREVDAVLKDAASSQKSMPRKHGCWHHIKMLILASLVCVVVSIIAVSVIDSLDEPETIARMVTDDPDATTTVTDTNLTVLFRFQSAETARDDARSIFPTLLCRLRNAGYTSRTYRIIGHVPNFGSGISVTLSPQEVSDYPCGEGTGTMDLRINPDLP